jgi:hypothetical protein
MFSMWVYFAAAFAIATLAFVLGQFVPGAGMPFVILTTTMWTAYAATRQRRLDQAT